MKPRPLYTAYTLVSQLPKTRQNKKFKNAMQHDLLWNNKEINKQREKVGKGLFKIQQGTLINHE